MLRTRWLKLIIHKVLEIQEPAINLSSKDELTGHITKELMSITSSVILHLYENGLTESIPLEMGRWAVPKISYLVNYWYGDNFDFFALTGKPISGH